MLDTGIADSSDASAITIDSSENVTIAGTLAVGTATFADNAKAIFGAGSDLQIYHTATGNHSIIEETGAGNLVVRTNGSQIEFDKGSTEYMARMIPDGAVELYHNNALKIATTATGINVTGTATMDGLTLDGANGKIYLPQTPNTFNWIGDSGEQTGIFIDPTNDNASEEIRLVVNNAKRLSINYLGDISFYEDTGTTAKLFWDASAESLGIGTASPDTSLHVNAAGSTASTNIQAGTVATFERSQSTAGAYVAIIGATNGVSGLHLGDPDNDDIGNITYNHTANRMDFSTNAAERMRIDSSGNVIVGKTSTSFSTDGAVFYGSGYNDFVNTSAPVQSLNRQTSDGAIVNYYKDAALVGSIGVNTGDKIYLGTGASGVAFSTAGLLPFSPSANNWSDNSLNLGLGGIRWKDLYLSGGVHLGGTGSANKLDDYEEGTWTPTWTNGIGNGSTSGTYVKVGNIVHVTALFTMGSTTSIGNKLEATNLPFTASQTTYSGARYENYQQNSYIGATRAASSQLRGYVINVAGSQATELVASTNAPFTWGVNDYAQLAVTYKTG